MLDDARHEIVGMQLEEAKADLAKIAGRLTLLARLRYLETLLTPRANDNGVAGILSAPHRREIRSHVVRTRRGSSTKSKRKFRICRPLVECRIWLRGPGNGGCEQRTQRRASNSRWVGISSRLSGAQACGPSYWPYRSSSRANYSLVLEAASLVCSRVSATRRRVDASLFENNPIFGADPISDYFGLFVWASSSDVASRALSNFKGA